MVDVNGLKRGQRANPLRIIWMENEKDKLLKENGHCIVHTAKKKMTRCFFFWEKKVFLQVLLIPEIAVCSERVIRVGINMEKGSSARRDPLTY